MKIGVLALQGAFIEHVNSLKKLGVDTILVKKKSDLKDIQGLILPRGESTAIGKLLVDLNLKDEIKMLIENGLPVFGTCAGMILLAKNITNDERKHLAMMDITVKRNAYGRQNDSFCIEENFKGISSKVEMVFIRAPYIEKVGENAEILATVNSNIVAARQKNMLVTSFHPELTSDLKVHQYFIDMIK
ncbi:pyridoxal 5'-phosphate synthase glutaminase subunit PdxT [Cetobacterium sp. 8H]|uniref:pyridoxal 5'-phosphate synthase glutaminase subunit PdxT n=1 Tax=Cetobacterium sp. 8H TaxID=2759681 RepID=UPI00163B63E1|nr:pyridoxal 5'-phosphate synthase glutaminase subunit PdxT [Cetobacterium sp. 8H]MBC2851939.1 pyridoxal 5'-phosphate synthase glutaminase subunit PdxT [Cetobacterium sp. 8H]